MFVQCKELFDRVAEFTPETGQLNEFSRTAEPDRIRGPVRGSYSTIGGRSVVLYRDDGLLWLRVDGEVLALDRRTRVELIELDPDGTEKLLRIAQGMDILMEWSYEPQARTIEGDLTPFVEEEDFDFALFLSNVSLNPDRQDLLYTDA